MPEGRQIVRKIMRMMMLSRSRFARPVKALALLVTSHLFVPYSYAQSVDSAPTTGFDIKEMTVRLEAFISNMNPQAAIGITIIAGLLLVVLGVGVLLLVSRVRASKIDANRRAELTNLSAALDRAESLIAAQNAVMIVWQDDTVDVLGKYGAIDGIPDLSRNILDFQSWLEPESADQMDIKISDLRTKGEAFYLVVAGNDGGTFAVEGNTAGGRALVSLRESAKVEQRNLELAQRSAILEREVEASRALLSALPMPVWIRNAENQLDWVNPAYAGAVGALDTSDAVAQARDLFDGEIFQDIQNTVAASGPYTETVRANPLLGSQAYDVLAVSFSRGSIGLARDSSELETVREKLGRLIQVYASTMDQVETAVAGFDTDGKLEFFNASYVDLWGLDVDWLNSGPQEGEILDALREARKLPDEADYHAWKKEQLAAGHDPDQPEMLWYLRGGRTLRILSGVHPLGTIYMYDDVSERFELESRHNTLIGIQREILDNLHEGAALFSSAGRLQLYNPAFARMWKLSNSQLTEQPHIEKIVASVKPLLNDNGVWHGLRDTITSLEGVRESFSGRFERRDGRVIDCGSVPLPGGGTLVTFTDVTDTFRAAEALKERNVALEKADQVKSIFIQHVSYVLRAPLTTIIGYADLISMDSTGSLNEVQSEYTGHILTATHSLLAIVNDILDLATINSGAMELELKSVDPLGVMEAASKGVRHRFLESGTRLDIVDPGDLGSFTADEKRLRQILFNLLSNAVDHSPANSCITMRCARNGGQISFIVEDQGNGIAEELHKQIFENFESYPSNKGQRGAGLGLSLVKSLVELHGGTVSVTSTPGKGAVFVCTFPVESAPLLPDHSD